MKHTPLYLVLLLFFLTYQKGYAEENPPTATLEQPSSTAPLCIRKSIFSNFSQRIYIGPDFSYRDYHEKLSHGGKSDEMGWLYGFQAGYEMISPCYFGIDLRINSGTTVYDGSTQSLEDGSFSPFQGSTNNVFIDTAYRAGYPFHLGSTLFAPFIGIGDHLWARLAIGGPGSYDEYYKWNYFLTGFVLYHNFRPSLMAGLRVQTMYMLNGVMQINGLAPFSLNVNLGSRWQYEVETPFGYHFNRCDIRFVPYFRKQNIGRSNNIPIGDNRFFFEPSSSTSVYGFRVELGYLF